ncbi:hypothetical protein DFH09DRAFT_1170545 [Mycena vulgaris]|nr:hypothetical protein DFH09DRAFT_1170545 [Mycena vulgaris]
MLAVTTPLPTSRALRLRASLSPGARPQAFAGNGVSSSAGLRCPVEASSRALLQGQVRRSAHGVTTARRCSVCVAGTRCACRRAETTPGDHADPRRRRRWDAGGGRGGGRGGSAGAAGGGSDSGRRRGSLNPSLRIARSLALGHIFRFTHTIRVFKNTTSSIPHRSQEAHRRARVSPRCPSTSRTRYARPQERHGRPRGVRRRHRTQINRGCARPWPLRRLRAFPSPSRSARLSSRRPT